jgi:cell division protein FtsZ
MSPYPHHEEPAKEAVITLIGIGNAGVNITDRLAMRAALPIRTIALNSDQQSLTASVASKKLVLGPMTTHGLGAGGDPERAIDAAKESLGELQEAVSGSDVVILCAGLGGGTGSAVTPLLAKMAKEKGALVVGVVTSPFQFEGRRRSQQAAESLAELARHVDALIHFENDRMAELVEPRADVSETFAACDGLLFQAIGGIVRMLGNPGPLPIAVNDLLSVLRAGAGGCLFGCGESEGGNRAHESLEQALRSPLLDRGRLLQEAGKILVHLSGPASLTFAEVAAVMKEISKNTSASANLCLGVSTAGDDSAPLIVTIIGRTGVEERKPTPAPSVAIPSISTPPPATPAPPVEDKVIADPEVASPTTKTQKVKQDFLPLEPIARGRFERSEPTIVEGEDLDVPTFLRLKIKK